MLAESGYGDVTVWLEPYGIFCVGKGVNESSACPSPQSSNKTSFLLSSVKWLATVVRRSHRTERPTTQLADGRRGLPVDCYAEADVQARAEEVFPHMLCSPSSGSVRAINCFIACMVSSRLSFEMFVDSIWVHKHMGTYQV